MGWKGIDNFDEFKLIRSRARGSGKPMKWAWYFPEGRELLGDDNNISRVVSNSGIEKVRKTIKCKDL